MVYVVQEQYNKNIWPAASFGKIKVILLDREQITFYADAAIERFQNELKDFSDNDYLVLTGDPIAIGVATHIAATNNKGKVKLLKWDKQEKVYIPINIDFKGESK